MLNDTGYPIHSLISENLLKIPIVGPQARLKGKHFTKEQLFLDSLYKPMFWQTVWCCEEQ